MQRNKRGTVWVALAILGLCAEGATAQDCEKTFDNTYDLIQEAIFENNGCTAQACHGAAAAGGLDLSAGVSYENLVEQNAQTVVDGSIPGLQRVVPGQKDQSLLFLNLAAATLPDQWDAPLRAMPIGVEALSVNELEAVREWIEYGAPRTGTVPGTGDLLDACLPPAKPIEIAPLEPPAPGTGVQMRMPRWTVPANSEDEACFVSYVDLTDQIPEKYLVSGGDFFAANFTQIRQDPLSHHIIVSYYAGTAAPDDPRWGPYRCRGGDKDGESCEPTDLDFCGEGVCGSDPVSGAVCAGFGPDDAQTTAFRFAGIQEASAQTEFPPGTFRPVPVKGLIIWNSHVFNITDEDGKSEAWLNFDFAEPEEQQFILNGVFNASSIFSMSVPPFEAQELCNHHLYPQNTRIYELNSHTHQRGKRFSIFEGRYQCQGGSRAGRACNPMPDEDMPDQCPSSECQASKATDSADCDLDGFLKVNDLVTCVNISLAIDDLASCPSADPNGDGDVSIAELVTFVKDSFEPQEFRDPEGDLLYTNLVYNDPTVVIYDDPPKPMEGSVLDRTITYCGLYDNGYSDPDEVKKRATSPESTGFLGGPCRIPTGCTEGNVGTLCSGDSEEERNASCDTSAGAGDGFCDGCQLRGGLTTEDEMFLLLGSFYVDPS